MARIRPIEFRKPNAKAIKEAAARLKLNAHQLTTLIATIEEAVSGCESLRKETDSMTTREVLSDFKDALAELEKMSGSNLIRAAFNLMDPNEAIGFIMSPSAALNVPGFRERALPGPSLHKLLDRDPLLSSVSPAGIDELGMGHRQVALLGLAPEALQYLFRALRQPIEAFLEKSKDRGGNRPRSDRDLLVLLLARDAVQIIGCLPQTSGTFVDLCDEVTHACGISEDGLSIAIKKCLKNNKEWLKWYRLQPYRSASGAGS